MDDKHIIAIEIGSSKIKGAIGSVDASGTVTVKAVEEMPLIDSVRYGQLGNVANAATTLRNIILKIENRMAPRKVEGVYVAVGGRSLTAVEKEVTRRLPSDTEVTDALISALKNEAAGAGVPDREILCVEPREFTIDDVRAEQPVGMYGSEIRMRAGLVVCRPQMKNNLPRLFEEKLQLRVNGYIVRQLALADLVLNSDEMKLGCMLVDFGAETTTVSVYKGGHMQYLATLPLGSRNITRDITQLNCVEEDAETLKCTRGTAYSDSEGMQTDDVRLSELNNYVSHRVAEIILNIREQVKLAGFTPSELPSGIIIVGCGNKLNGFNDRLQKESNMPVRTGTSISPSVRIADGRISPNDAVDVIAVLLAAARMNPQECLSEIVVEEPEEIQTSDTDTDDDEDFVTESPKKSWSLGDFIRSVSKKIIDVDDPGSEGSLEDDEDA